MYLSPFLEIVFLGYFCELVILTRKSFSIVSQGKIRKIRRFPIEKVNPIYYKNRIGGKAERRSCEQGVVKQPQQAELQRRQE